MLTETATVSWYPVVGASVMDSKADEVSRMPVFGEKSAARAHVRLAPFYDAEGKRLRS